MVGGPRRPGAGEAIDWQGRPWTPASTEKAAHPNSRFTTPATECASLSPEFANPDGVPIDAILFGARRQRRVPLVYEARSWQHGTFLGATLSSETTAAATGKVGVLRRDPMAMLPFCGYNMADYWGHWLDVGRALTRPPRIFRVNWFRTGEDGKFLWPGFGDNLRVLKWILERCEGGGAAVETPIGLVPDSRGARSQRAAPAGRDAGAVAAGGRRRVGGGGRGPGALPALVRLASAGAASTRSTSIWRGAFTTPSRPKGGAARRTA